MTWLTPSTTRWSPTRGWRGRVADRGAPSPGEPAPIAIATVGALFELIADWLFDNGEDVDRLIAQMAAYHRILRAGLESTVDGVSSDR